MSKILESSIPPPVLLILPHVIRNPSPSSSKVRIIARREILERSNERLPTCTSVFVWLPRCPLAPSISDPGGLSHSVTPVWTLEDLVRKLMLERSMAKVAEKASSA